MIVIIDNYDSFTYNLYQLVAEQVENVKVIRNDAMSVEEILKLNPSGIILSPGPGRPENAGICIELVKKLYDKIPILGVCLGHQAIAEAFGGQVILSDNVVHGKSAWVFHTRRGIYKGMPLPFEAGRYHSLIVDRDSLPKEFIIDSETDNGKIMGMKHIKYPCFGVQFHPESILTPEGQMLVKNFVKICK